MPDGDLLVSDYLSLRFVVACGDEDVGILEDGVVYVY